MVFFGTKFLGGKNLKFMLGGFYNEREYFSTDWLDPLITFCPIAVHPKLSVSEETAG